MNRPNAGPATHLAIELGLLGILAVLWGGSYLLIKIAVISIPPVTLIAFRVTVAAFLLLLVCNYYRARLPRDALTWRALFVQSFLNAFGAWTVLAWGQQYIDSGLAGVLNSTSPIFVCIITATFMRDARIGRYKILGAGLGICGVILIVGIGTLDNMGKNLIAQAAVLLGAALYALAAIYGTRFARLPAMVTAAGTMVCATCVLLPASLILDQPWTLTPAASGVLSAIALAVFCTAAALLIYFRLIRTLGALGVASQSYLRAGVSVTLGIFILNEEVTMSLAAGLTCVIIGVALINWGSQRSTT